MMDAPPGPARPDGCEGAVCQPAPPLRPPQPAFLTSFLLRRRIRACLLRCARSRALYPYPSASLRNPVRKAGQAPRIRHKTCFAPGPDGLQLHSRPAGHAEFLFKQFPANVPMNLLARCLMGSCAQAAAAPAAGFYVSAHQRTEERAFVRDNVPPIQVNPNNL
jgi:hypothetical protein